MEATKPACGRCQHFQNDPATLEEAFPGFTAMGSGHASVRVQDGLCRQHGIYLSADDHCPSFLPVAAQVERVAAGGEVHLPPGGW